MSDTGFVKLYRKMLDNPVVCKDADHIAVWIYILLSATWQPCEIMFEGKKTTLEPGQLVTGRQAIGVHSKINEYKVQRILKLFESEQLIAQQTTPRNRLISVLNWNQYQSNAQQNAQQLHNSCTTSAQQSAHKQEEYKKKEEEEEYKEDKNKYKQQRYFDFDELNDAFMSYIEMRKKIKAPMTDKAIKIAINKLNKLASDDDYKKIAIINESVLNNWKGLYEYNGKIERPEKPDPIQEKLETPGTIFFDVNKYLKEERGIDGLDSIGKQERKNW